MERERETKGGSGGLSLSSLASGSLKQAKKHQTSSREGSWSGPTSCALGCGSSGETSDPVHMLVCSLTPSLQLIAEDADSQPNGQIQFSIVSGDRDNEFAVDPVLGLVKVQKTLDRERVS